jgi:hypothetical protein
VAEENKRDWKKHHLKGHRIEDGIIVWPWNRLIHSLQVHFSLKRARQKAKTIGICNGTYITESTKLIIPHLLSSLPSFCYRYRLHRMLKFLIDIDSNQVWWRKFLLVIVWKIIPYFFSFSISIRRRILMPTKRLCSSI